MECLLRCSRVTECNSVAIEEIRSDPSSGGYCQLYRAPFEENSGHNNGREHKQYYNKNDLV